MENDLHATENRLLGLLPETQWVRLKTQRMRVEMGPARMMYKSGDDVDPTRLCPGRGRKLRTLLFLLLSCCLSTVLASQDPTSTHPTSTHPRQAKPKSKSAHHAHLDRSGKTRKGEASYYGDYGSTFYKKKMADGTHMDPQSSNAASKTLPLGTKARVTNLENGHSEVVEIRDRGPYVKDRIVDVSPKTADNLGLKKDGTAPVEVKPVEVPQADGSMKPGAGATQSRESK
ncbi:septal ring lytic transglycosylase RlpA family protein [Burkholderia sp. L27(2015)]|uniref:septal ring lytic transglycosylase RlpA family protein n=1 Tax=Burkholderia sp. L27(2015) TaxID=1641858 RepID=UPI0020B12206|nr:septal ring lytic transglycosylase RlpA family protein [Burkholderia sp. L27(2015)]